MIVSFFFSKKVVFLKKKMFFSPVNLLRFFIAICVIRMLTGDEHSRLKCLICRRTMDEFRDRVNLLDPNIQVPSGGYIIDSNGVTLQKVISQRKSEQKLSDILERICVIFEDFARAKNKTNDQLTIVRLVNAKEQMDFNAAEVDFIPDDNQNRGLKYVCEELIGEFAEDIIKTYQNHEDMNLHGNVCGAKVSNFCADEADDDVNEDGVGVGAGAGAEDEHNEL